MTFSIYTSAFNLLKMGFDWKPVLDNWVQFLNGRGEISIAVNTSEDGTFEALNEYARASLVTHSAMSWKIVKTEIPYTDPWFDGKIKNAALRNCTSRFAILLDLDEVIPLWSRDAWQSAVGLLEQNGFRFDALLIPSIDLFHDEHHMKGGIGGKWYLHFNRPNLGRGPVGFARREDGTIDITKSDTTELIDIHTNELARYGATLDPRFSDVLKLNLIQTGTAPVVYHLGWLNKEQRLRQSAFWAPVWNAREGKDVEQAKTADELAGIEYRPHGLRHWTLT
jgi:hypothetical protein